MDYKPHPEKFDFKRDIMCINHTTGRMLLSALTLITPQKRGQQIHDIINNAIALDWSDATHSLDVTYTPDLSGSNGTTTLHISVQPDTDACVDVTVDFDCTQQVALYYKPMAWAITITKKGRVLKVDRGHFYANTVYFRKESKGWMRLPIEGEYPYPHMTISNEAVIFQNAAELMIIHVPES